jgi:5-methylcytosine-specific restriction endonuclease McrA
MPVAVKPCVKCGAVDRYKSGGCRPCHNERQKRWNEANRETIRQINKRYYDSNAKALREAIKLNRENNREYYREYLKRWNEANREAQRTYKHNRRARIKSSGKLSKNIAQRLFTAQKGKCACCKIKLENYHIDHIMPLALGGLNVDNNVQLLCPPCNLSKGAKHPVDFMRERGMLL